MLLDYDLMGLQTRRYEHNLLDTLSTELDGAIIGEVFKDGKRSLWTRVYPIGIDPDEMSQMASQAGQTAAGRFLRRISPGHQIVLGVDRLDYTKGIGQRLQDL